MATNLSGSSGSNLDLSKFTLPIVRRVFSPMFAQQIVSVQPMKAPVGSIFYFEENPCWKKLRRVGLQRKSVNWTQ
jgi:hypothetical protein